MMCKCKLSRSNYPSNDWEIIEYRYTPKGYCRVRCRKCKCVWLAHAKYIKRIKNEVILLNEEMY